MRLAIITTNHRYPWGGAEHLWHDVALAARSRGCPVLAIAGPHTLDSTPIKNLREAGVEVGVLPPADAVNGGRLAPFHKIKRRYLGSRNEAGSQIRAFKPDLLIVNQCGSFDGAWELWLQGVIKAEALPYITLSHNNDGKALSSADKKSCLTWCLNAKAVFFVSEENKLMGETQLGTRLPHASLAQNPFPIPQVQLNWPPSPPFRFGVVGRLEIHEKGLDLIVAAAKEVLASEEGWEINFFGKGPEAESLRAMIDKTGLSDRIHLRGYTTKPLDIWKDHHACILASRWEGFSIVMAEALACGRPVLRTRSGGASWILEGETGWICEPDNLDSLASTLRKAWIQRANWQQMGVAARTALLQRADPQPAHTFYSKCI